ncbi:MAG TPA: aldolase/citrate lyase family protein [Stellaceae bacterium]|nr:aldolase/citrate lyase family protein [Stellaceae bacterium]
MTDRATESGVSRVRKFKARLAAGETVLGAWLTIPELSVAEIMAGSGFDYVIIDAEHAPWTVAEIQIALAGFAKSETVLLVRVPWNDQVAIKQVLDAGVDGLVCPMVRTVEEARSLIAACRYPPAGTRGFGPRRASGYYRNAAAYAAAANAELVIVPQIEDARFLHELDGILALDGVDAICLGPADFSGSLGRLLDWKHPEVARALDTVLSKARAEGIAVCTGIVIPPEAVPEWVAKGARMPLIAADTGLLLDGAAALLKETRRIASP